MVVPSPRVIYGDRMNLSSTDSSYKSAQVRRRRRDLYTRDQIINIIIIIIIARKEDRRATNYKTSGDARQRVNNHIRGRCWLPNILPKSCIFPDKKKTKFDISRYKLLNATLVVLHACCHFLRNSFFFPFSFSIYFITCKGLCGSALNACHRKYKHGATCPFRNQSRPHKYLNYF